MTKDYRYILVVDDMAGLRRLLYETLSDDGYIVEMAADGVEAIQKVRSRVRTTSKSLNMIKRQLTPMHARHSS